MHTLVADRTRFPNPTIPFGFKNPAALVEWVLGPICKQAEIEAGVFAEVSWQDGIDSET